MIPITCCRSGEIVPAIKVSEGEKIGVYVVIVLRGHLGR